MGLTSSGSLDLATFDGDVTLYDDGKSLEPTNEVINRIICTFHTQEYLQNTDNTALMENSTRIGIVTAAGYTEAEKYYERLYGLLEAVRDSSTLTPTQKQNLVVMGGESNFLFKFSISAPHLLEWIPRRDWILPQMHNWTEETIQALLDRAEDALKECISTLSLPAIIIRKSRAVGIIHRTANARFPREQLEETVLVIQKILEMSPVGKIIPFCAFNGGNDVFVDIGDKSWGVQVVQSYFGGVEGSRTLHVGDQFLSAGANDFKARVVGTTAWIANPVETVELLDELQGFLKEVGGSGSV